MNTVDSVMLSNPKDREVLLSVVKECSVCLDKIMIERETIKELISGVCEKLDLSKRVVNKVVRTYNKNNYQNELAISDEFQTLYETIIKE